MIESNIRLALALACLSCISGSAAEQKILAGDPNTSSRTVSYHDTDIVPIATEIRFTTLIELPKEESIVEVTCGDKEFWPVNWTGNLAYVKPARQGSRTNMNLITASGNVYSFIATEVSEVTNAHADLKVFVNPSDGSAIVAMKDKPRFVSADTVEGYKKAADQAQQQLQANKQPRRRSWSGKSRSFGLLTRRPSNTITNTPSPERIRSM